MVHPIRLICLLLAGCASAPHAPAPNDTAGSAAAVSAPASDAPRRVPDAVLHGQLVWPDGEQPGVGSRARLTLAHRFAEQLPLAEIEVALDGAAPFAFQVPFVRDDVADSTVYRLDVSVYAEDGRLRWVSDGEHPVNLDRAADPSRVVLMAIEQFGVRHSQWDCGDDQATLRGPDPEPVLSVRGADHHLRRAHAAVGVRYVGAAAELWIRGDRARLQIADARQDCLRLPDEG